jgi:hypothetical protein
VTNVQAQVFGGGEVRPKHHYQGKGKGQGLPDHSKMQECFREDQDPQDLNAATFREGQQTFGATIVPSPMLTDA